MGYFDDNSINEETRRNEAFIIIAAVRELLTIAKESEQIEPYKRAIRLVAEAFPESYSQMASLLRTQNENELVKYFEEKAELQSENDGIKIHPIDLVNTEIRELETLLRSRTKNSTVKTRLIRLRACREQMNPRYLPEDKSIKRDFSLTDRRGSDFFLKKLYATDTHSDFLLPNDKILRLRLLHPDSGERATGADLIYERFDLKGQRVRFVHLQYKTFDNNDRVYFSQGNLKAQINKINDNLCANAFCKSGISDTKFRFPNCSGFLRPTDRIQSPDSKLMTSGYHMPICRVKELINAQKQIDKDMLRSECVTHKIFEELFNKDLIGSKWISIDELEKFYASKQIVANLDTIRVHAQEVII